MILLAWILSLAAVTRVNLVDEVYSIPADQWRYVEVALKRQPALVLAHYDVLERGGVVRVALMRREDMEHMRDGLPHGVVASSGPGANGTLRAEVAAGDYVVVVDNQTSGERAETVHLRVWLDFTRAPVVTGISPRRQLIVILLSFAVFFGIVTYSMRRLWRAAKLEAGDGPANPRRD